MWQVVQSVPYPAAACGGEDESCEKLAWYADYDADGVGGGAPSFACTAGSGSPKTRNEEPGTRRSSWSPSGSSSGR